MNGWETIIECLKAENIEYVFALPTTHLIGELKETSDLRVIACYLDPTAHRCGNSAGKDLAGQFRQLGPGSQAERRRILGERKQAPVVVVSRERQACVPLRIIGNGDSGV